MKLTCLSALLFLTVGAPYAHAFQCDPLQVKSMEAILGGNLSNGEGTERAWEANRYSGKLMEVKTSFSKSLHDLRISWSPANPEEKSPAASGRLQIVLQDGSFNVQLESGEEALSFVVPVTAASNTSADCKDEELTLIYRNPANGAKERIIIHSPEERYFTLVRQALGEDENTIPRSLLELGAAKPQN